MRRLAFALLAGFVACGGTPPTTEATLDKGTSEMKSAIQRAVADPTRAW